jgi:hypothetical protein
MSEINDEKPSISIVKMYRNINLDSVINEMKAVNVWLSVMWNNASNKYISKAIMKLEISASSYNEIYVSINISVQLAQ